MSLLAWANVPFTAVLCIAVMFALIQMSGVLGLLAGGDHDGDADHDVDAHHDVDAGHDTDADGDAGHDADHDHDHDSDQENGSSAGLLAGLGVGKVPLSIIWQTYAVAFGLAGIIGNTIYLGYARSLPPYTLAWTLPLALVFGYLVTRRLGRVLARVAADPRHEATTRKELVGHTGVVISSKISSEFGEVRLMDKTGHTLRIICRTRDSEPTIPEGREVVIVEYDKEGNHLFVAPLDESIEPRPEGRKAAL
jgi:membrane protein implicated in regulation of membrane protease activity